MEVEKPKSWWETGTPLNSRQHPHTPIDLGDLIILKRSNFSIVYFFLGLGEGWKQLVKSNQNTSLA